jgi:flagellar biosynthetic protein FliQ
MSPDQVIDVMRHLMVMAAMIAGPVMLSGMATGVFMGILQSATQIQEATLAFVPKLVVVGIAMVLGGPWAIDKLVTYTDGMLTQIVDVAPRGRG